MPLFDLPLEQLRRFTPEVAAPADFDEFWRRTLHESPGEPAATTFRPLDAGLPMVEISDVAFAGYGGDTIRGWFLTPSGATAPMGCVVKYIGYHGGRGYPHDHLLWPAAGWATLVVDTRGQGGSSTNSHGATGDPHGTTTSQAPGWLTMGIDDPDAHYYRRVFTDAVRAVDVAAGHPLVDPDRIVVAGHSQGGGIAQAVSGLHNGVAAALINEPFLTHYRRSAEIASSGPYSEIVTYLATQRDQQERVFTTLSYFDGVNFAARARARALYSVALMDTSCPPSTVFAAYNAWGGPKDISVWPWNGHEGGGSRQADKQLAFLRENLQ